MQQIVWCPGHARDGVRLLRWLSNLLTQIAVSTKVASSRRRVIIEKAHGAGGPMNHLGASDEPSVML